MRQPCQIPTRLVEPLICTQSLPAFEHLLRTAGFRAPFSWRRRGGGDPEVSNSDAPAKPRPPGTPGACALTCAELTPSTSQHECTS